MTIRILIADDHGVLRGGLRALLHAEPDLQVVGEAADGHQTLRLAAELSPNVLLLDISMPGPNGMEVARQIHETQPGVRVLFLTMHEDRGLLQEALRVGASGYIVKRAVESDLISAIRTVARGEQYVHATMAWALSDEPSQGHNNGGAVDMLTQRELKVLRLMAQSYTNHQIADALGVDVPVVERERANLTGKLGLCSRVALIRYAREHGLLDGV